MSCRFRHALHHPRLQLANSDFPPNAPVRTEGEIYLVQSKVHPGLTLMKGDPLLRNLERDPSWPAFLKKMILPWTNHKGTKALRITKRKKFNFLCNFVS
jgi:hypothetical protein